MDEDKIGLVLAKTSELRSKIASCIHRVSITLEKEARNGVPDGSGADEEAAPGEVYDDEATECLLNVRDVLDSLEAQLSSLQVLQQQQWYERESALAEIGHIQKKLLKKLKEYKGEDLDVIQEAIAFVGESAEDNNDLLLPPYPSRPFPSLVSDNGYLSHIPSSRKFTQNATTSGGPKTELVKDLDESGRNQSQAGSKGLFKGVKFLVKEAAKITATVLGVISILTLAGFEPSLRRRDSHSDIQDLLGPVEVKFKCPPGKVPVDENGETRCIVKERVEIPFESDVTIADVNYGHG